jgi:chloride channel 3/4/5
MDAHQHRLDNKRKRIEYKQQGWLGILKALIWGSQGWIALLAVGLATAATTVLIQSTSVWLLGIRKGVCSFGVFVDQNNCCLEKAGDLCENWKSWSEIISGGKNEYADYAIYVFTGVALAMMSGFYTMTFSEKAAGGGIPEVKSVLGGFIFRQILGVWVLFIKTIGIVCFL